MGNRYLSNLALSLIGQLRLTWDDLGTADSISKFGLSRAQNLYEKRNKEIKALLAKMRPETLGRIAACGKAYPTNGKTSLYQVHCESYLDRYADGKSLLFELACTAVVAEMTDILRHRFEVYAADCDPIGGSGYQG